MAITSRAKQAKRVPGPILYDKTLAKRAPWHILFDTNIPKLLSQAVQNKQNDHQAIYWMIKLKQNDHHGICWSIKHKENVRAIPRATSGLNPNEANRAGVRHIASKTCPTTSGKRTADQFSDPKGSQYQNCVRACERSETISRFWVM